MIFVSFALSLNTDKIHYSYGTITANNVAGNGEFVIYFSGTFGNDVIPIVFIPVALQPITSWDSKAFIWNIDWDAKTLTCHTTGNMTQSYVLYYVIGYKINA